MITAQIPQAAAENGTFPKEFAMQNDKEAPVVSLWVTSTIMQLFMFLVYFSSNAWNTMLTITGVMVLPAYLSSCAYLWKICEDHEYPTKFYIKRSTALLSGILGAGYSAWLIYAAGLKYLMLAVIFMALGIPVYVWAKHQNEPEAPFFTPKEKCLAIMMVFVAFVALYAMISGIVKL
jgi:arginine:ornithine antiporter/lysine permease